MSKNKQLFREERLVLILEKISKDKKIVVNDLAKHFGVSSSSIRLDLRELEARRLVTRTHGGAILPNDTRNSLVLEKSFLQQREETNTREKEAIARATVDLISDGDSIIIDGGSTTTIVVKYLGEKRGLTVVTTSIHLLPTLMEIPDAKVYLTGGLIHREFEDMIGEISLDSIGRFNPDKAIIGIDGISLKHGLTTTSPQMAPLKRKMISISKKTIVVCDSSKLEKVCLLHVADFNEISTIVTDDCAPAGFIEEVRKTGTNILVSP